MEGETQGEMVLMYTIHNTQLCGGGGQVHMPESSEKQREGG